MTLKKTPLAALFAATATLLVACGASNKQTSSDAWDSYKQKKTITLGFDNTFVPMGYKDESGKNTGFDIELAKAVFDQYGINVKYQAINWDLKETELNNGKIDLIWNGYSVTKERQAKVVFTEPYMKNEQVLVTQKSSQISSFADMKNKTLGAQSGSSGYDAFTSHPKVLKDLVKGNDATQYETFTQAFIDLKNKRIDGLLIDRVYANYYLQQEGELDRYNIIASEFEGEDFAVGVRKADKTLQKKITQALKSLYQDGTFQKISKKWFGEDVATVQLKS
ncbi:TPA: amino acid ABC transporter substrate-binding protein [Streptococcus equi subsp. zooepidemicus]|uniref:amino acid ABC transporter substrate-binding protein n=1 Tax=Streptococcus equi TaxID=1336 RepID=UPI000DFC628E|nr:amino acid ABC transporter substrate-binding protein [Streptococcus equi]MCD3381647.1 amino acid ABC transporter substrate-binding protein [Streptococcus equi subsp. zooepidemicus]MCD3420411.1 amino acid ABC transporter substrate-binding protein [Streptococcus equi subsp. zooepidemicus]QTZ57098.1 ABC transporter arginine-binding protein 1 [Streptococcus equi subsp. zooepidemicus]SUN53450.1 amino acid ABC transporter permease/substrate-binding protein [Streptococcus equi subsp. zooepidemicus]